MSDSLTVILPNKPHPTTSSILHVRLDDDSLFVQAEGIGTVIEIERFCGLLRVCVFSNKASDRPTHIINLEGGTFA